jgi:glycerol-3-phosphate acyltransferase PlsX
VIRISIDAMGGDRGPGIVLPGLARVLERRPDVRFVIFGREDVARPILDTLPKLKEASEFVHSEVAVAMDEKPSQALRHGRGKSSMWMALDAVREGRADACVSAGNTGALMAMSLFCLNRIADVERPAISAIWPTTRGESIVLDVGANIGAEARQLVDYAILGTAMARALFGLSRSRRSACSMSASRRPRARKRSRMPAACCARPTSRAWSIAASWKATTLARAPSMWS